MVGDMLGASGAPLEFRHGERVYAVSPVTQRHKAAIEAWLRRKAYEDVFAQKEHLPPAMYADLLTSLQVNRAAYAYLGPVFLATLGSPAGPLMMTCVLLGVGEDEAQALLDERHEDLEPLINEAMLASMPRALAEKVRAGMQAAQAQEKADPNTKGPA